MTCAKVTVTARLVLPDGRTFIGTNACRAPQAQCPRKEGEGYDKCETVCHQLGHAEVMAIVEALRSGASVEGGEIEVGHTHVCNGCASVMRDKKVSWRLKQ